MKFHTIKDQSLWSKCPGVSWSKSKNAWYVALRFLGRRYCVGAIKDLAKAEAAAKSIRDVANSSDFDHDLISAEVERIRASETRKPKVLSKVYVKGEVCSIEILNKAGSVVQRALIDQNLASELAKHKWVRGAGMYCGYYKPLERGGASSFVLMHRLVMVLSGKIKQQDLFPGVGSKTVVDHINRNPLDNRLQNLRLASQSLNRFNTAGSSLSGYVGVVRTPIGRYAVSCTVKGRNTHFGTYDSLAEAAVRSYWVRNELVPEAVIGWPVPINVGGVLRFVPRSVIDAYRANKAKRLCNTREVTSR